MSSLYQSAWLLHSRPYRERSALAWFFTLESGRVDAVVRGVRTRKSRYRALLQPFTPLTVAFKGTQSLKSLTGLEATGTPHWFQKDALVCALYANELLSRLLHPEHACPDIFGQYTLLLNCLPQAKEREPALRTFEFSLLEWLGATPGWQTVRGEPLLPGCYYTPVPEQGWLPVFPRTETAATQQPPEQLFTGEALLAMAADDWSALRTRREAKHLTRQLLQPLLGSRPLYSRQLAQQFRSL